MTGLVSTPVSQRIETFFSGDPETAARAVVERAERKDGGYACLANVHVVVMASRDGLVDGALADAWAVFPDGWPVAWLQRRIGRTGASRVAGPDLMPLVIELGQDRGLRHFLFGSTEDVVSRLRNELQRRLPGADIVGALAPPVGVDLWAPEVKASVRAARPDIVWCALGAPKQELWMRSHHRELAPALLLGVGAAFDFIAGAKPRAPLAVQRLGLEWLHRLLSEPRRLWRRYLETNLVFVLVATRAIFEARGSAARRRLNAGSSLRSR